MHPPRHRIFVGKDVHKYSSAHMTVFPDGTKERLHGHNFQVTVAFDLRDVALAHLLDFGVIKRALAAQCAAWDQRLLLAENCPHFQLHRRDEAQVEFSLCGKRYSIPADEVLLLPVENVVVEVMAGELARALVARLGDALAGANVLGVEVNITEAEGQGATSYLTLEGS